jgi:hypothetical protein
MRRFITLSVGLLILFGCAQKKETAGIATGSISYKGQKVNGATLILYSKGDSGTTYNVNVNQDGTFRAVDIPPGDYIVVVRPNPGMSEHTKGANPAALEKMKDKMKEMEVPATIPIPDKYKDRTKTDLSMTIVLGEQKIEPIELKD